MAFTIMKGHIKLQLQIAINVVDTDAIFLWSMSAYYFHEREHNISLSQPEKLFFIIISVEKDMPRTTSPSKDAMKIVNELGPFKSANNLL